MSTLAALDLLALTTAAICWIDASIQRPGLRFAAAFLLLLGFEAVVALIAGGPAALREIATH